MRGVNLIPVSRILARRRLRRARLWTVGCAAYAGVLAGCWSVMSLVGTGSREAVAEIAALEDRIAEDRALAAAMQPRLRAAVATIEASRSIGNQPDWSLLLAVLASELGDDAVLTSCELSGREGSGGGGYDVRLGGAARSHAAVLGYVRKLEDCGLFGKVTLIETRPGSAVPGAAIGFAIECGLTDGREGKR